MTQIWHLLFRAALNALILDFSFGEMSSNFCFALLWQTLQSTLGKMVAHMVYLILGSSHWYMSRHMFYTPFHCSFRLLLLLLLQPYYLFTPHTSNVKNVLNNRKHMCVCKVLSLCVNLTIVSDFRVFAFHQYTLVGRRSRGVKNESIKANRLSTWVRHLTKDYKGRNEPWKNTPVTLNQTHSPAYVTGTVSFC